MLCKFTKVQHVDKAIPESQKLPEPYNLGCNADRQLSLTPSDPKQVLLLEAAVRPLCAPVVENKTCREPGDVCVNMGEKLMEHVQHCGCSLHYVFKRVYIQSAAQIRHALRGEGGEIPLN